MARLIARSLDGHTASLELTSEPQTIGRTDDSALRLAFDPAVSRQHGSARWEAGVAILDCTPGARNGFLLPSENQPQRQVRLRVGESAIIGQTQLTVEASAREIAPPLEERSTLRFARERPAQPDIERTLAPLPTDDIRSDARLAVLSRLPGVLDAAVDDAERSRRVLELVLVGVKSATTAAVVRRQAGAIHLIAWDRVGSFGDEPAISSRLVGQALD